MRQYTTPVVQLRIDGHTVSGDVYVTFSNKARNVTLTIDSPSVSPSLWVRIDDPSQEWPEWVQPTGGTDAYAMGAKVSHNGKHLVSDYDANIWEPGVFGWHEVA